MINYMEYVQRCFYSETNWNVENLHENILATSDNIINFSLPRGLRFDIGSNATDYNYSNFSFSNEGKLNGSIAYLYCSKPLGSVNGSTLVPLQNAIKGYRMIETSPSYYLNSVSSFKKKESVLYGKMYFPTRALEAMYINRFSPTSQFMIKCINLPKQTRKLNLNSGIMTFYLQNDKGKYSREFIFSTNEALLGFRFLYNFGYKDNKYRKLFDKNLDVFAKNLHIDSSMLSLGTELWYGALNMSPGFSSSLRYTTHSTSTGKPLTFTLSCNPILGNISSTYSVRSSVSTSFSSKYDFNIYSYESNLSLGCELWQYSRHNPIMVAKELKRLLESDLELKKHHDAVMRISKKKPNLTSYIQNDTGLNRDLFTQESSDFGSKENTSIIKTFSKLVNESDFSSVVKLSTSLKDKNLKCLWEGRFKGFLMSGGCIFEFKKNSLETPVVGLQVQFSS